MSAMKDVVEIFRDPAGLGADLAERPRWRTPCLIAALVAAVAGYVVTPIAMRESAERFADSRWAQNMPEEQLEQTVEQMKNPSMSAIMVQGVAGSVLAVLVGQILLFSAIAHGLARAMGGRGSFKSVMSLVSWSRLIYPVAGTVVALPMILARDTVFGISLSPAALFPEMDPMGVPFAVLSIFDLFGLWFLAAATLGLERVHAIPRVRAAIATGLPWLAGGLLGVLQRTMMG